MTDVYLKPNPLYKSYYLQKIERIKKADLYLSNSDSSKDELIKSLWVSSDAVSTIYAGIDKKLFKKLTFHCMKFKSDYMSRFIYKMDIILGVKNEQV